MTQTSPAIRPDRFKPGARIGDYIVEREVGSEATGVIYLATHAMLPRRANVKVMHAGSSWLRSIAVQMLREACLLEALSHPAIPKVFECGVLPDRRPWTAFERIDGVTLAALLSRGQLTIADVVVVLRDVADLLAHVHARGVVHRRLTANAIARTPDRGFSVCVRHWDDALTFDTASCVTVNARNDVHALGVVAFRALTGSVSERAASAAERCPGAPSELTELIDDMLSSDPDARPSAAEVRDRVRWLADSFHVPMIGHVRWTPPHGLDTEAIPKTTASESIPARTDLADTKRTGSA